MIVGGWTVIANFMDLHQLPNKFGEVIHIIQLDLESKGEAEKVMISFLYRRSEIRHHK